MENEISITQQYPPANYNLLGNTAVMVSIPDIKSPVIQKIKINPNPDAGEVYIRTEMERFILQHLINMPLLKMV